MARFSNKRILITGGSRGIGLAGAKQIVVEGGEVILTGRSNDQLEALRAEFSTPPLTLQNDAANAESAAKLAEEIGQIGKLDGLWLNAGYAEVAPIDEIDADFFDAMMNANVRGPVLQIAKLGGLLNDGASVVVTASTSVYEGAAMASIYAATKGALVSLARCWASALAPRGIRVNTLVPGPIATGFRTFMGDERQAAFEEEVVGLTALGRIGSAEEAAAVALFLLSDTSSYVTGSQYAVDGGLTMR